MTSEAINHYLEQTAELDEFQPTREADLHYFEQLAYARALLKMVAKELELHEETIENVRRWTKAARSNLNIVEDA